LLADRLLTPGKVTCVGIVGMPGIGKTTVANALLDKLQHSFKTRIITVGQQPDEQALLSRVWKEVKPNDSLPLELTKGRFDADQACKMLCEIIRAETETRPTLLLLDDVWTAREVRDLDFVTLYGGANRLVVTTRDERTLDERDPEEHHREWVPALSDENARKLLCYHAFRCEEPGPGYEKVVPHVLKHCKNLPLTIQVGAASLLVAAVCQAVISCKPHEAYVHVTLCKCSSSVVQDRHQIAQCAHAGARQQAPRS
jgi:hypothetical protein